MQDFYAARVLGALSCWNSQVLPLGAGPPGGDGQADGPPCPSRCGQEERGLLRGGGGVPGGRNSVHDYGPVLILDIVLGYGLWPQFC